MKRLLVFLLPSMVFAAADDQWARSYRKLFSKEDQRSYQVQIQSTFERTDVLPFTQLIFSWNALRPQRGSLVFYGQIKDQTTGKWGAWHRMMSWGASEQRSYEDKKQVGGVSSYHFVRLETEKKHLADGFRIKIEGEQGASLGVMRSFVVTVANHDAFIPESIPSFAHLPTILIKGVPRISQFMLDHADADRLCSPTSCSMVGTFLGSKIVDPLQFAHHVYDEGLSVYGSWPFNTAHLFEVLGGRVQTSVVRMNSFKELHAQLVKGMPVVVSVRGYLEGAPKSYDNGHLLVVVGWNEERKEVLCNDPAQKTHDDVFVAYTCKDFIAAWERSRRLAYLVEPSPVLL